MLMHYHLLLTETITKHWGGGLTFAVRKSVVSICTPATVVSIIVRFTGTLAPSHLTHTSDGTIHVTLTWLAAGPTKVTYVTPCKRDKKG